MRLAGIQSIETLAGYLFAQTATRDNRAKHRSSLGGSVTLRRCPKAEIRWDSGDGFARGSAARAARQPGSGHRSILGLATNVTLVGETSVTELETRPDFAVTKQNCLSASSRSRLRERAPIHAASTMSTIRSSGRSSRRCRTSSTPMAIPSASGRTASFRARSFVLEGSGRERRRRFARARAASLRLFTDFLQLAAHPAPLRHAARRDQRAPLPAVAGRSDRADGPCAPLR